jgi:hypothetical protein
VSSSGGFSTGGRLTSGYRSGNGNGSGSRDGNGREGMRSVSAGGAGSVVC